VSSSGIEPSSDLVPKDCLRLSAIALGAGNRHLRRVDSTPQVAGEVPGPTILAPTVEP
jgi:hypothetical protein